MFGRKLAEDERNKEVISEELADLEVEEAIIEDKQRFGRVRTSLMRYLRMQYGKDIANRALCRVNKRKSEGYLKLG
jgi:hypothetical protein